MTGLIQKELEQSKPLESVQIEAFLNVLRTATVLQHLVQIPLKPEGLTQEQYNVLRILRGAGEEGCSCQKISARMITRDPDITRLLDKLVNRRLASRERGTRDRRVVVVRIAKDGLALLDKLDAPMRAGLGRLVGHLTDKQARDLVDLLEITRQGAEEPVSSVQ